MKPFTAGERKKFILDYVKEHEFADIGYLTEMLQVSDMTVRRDLKKLEEENHGLVRVLGGARSFPGGSYEEPVDKRVRVHSREKERIARYAASLVCEGDSIFMDASSTVYAMTDYLSVRATVITNNISVCLKLKDKEKLDVILAGGSLRKRAMSLVGPDALHVLERYYVDKAFLSSKAVDAEFGISDATREETEVKKAMMKSSREVYFLMDHYKWGNKAFCKVCDICRITELIADESEDEGAAEFIRQCGKENGNIRYV